MENLEKPAGQDEYYTAIRKYYDTCEIDYKLLWRLDRCMALHYGYWDDTTRGVSDALLRQNQVLAEKARITPADKVLDAGCGVGGSSIWLAKNIGCQEIKGITIVEGQVKTATKYAVKHKVENNISFEQRDYLNTGYPDESFDVVWALESVCHAMSKPDFIREAFRVLKPGGRLVVADFFSPKEQLTQDEKDLMSDWLEGWSVNGLGYGEGFLHSMQETGFVNAYKQVATENVIPSAKRLYRYSLLTRHGAKLLAFLHLRAKNQNRNINAVYQQWHALKYDLWEYDMFYGEKPQATA